MGLLRELYRRFEAFRNKPGHWRLRPHTIDRRLFRDVIVRNEYELPARFDAGDVILDVGAHTGSFALAALRRGAGVVHCWEVNPDNFPLLQHNLRPYAGRAVLSPHAVWRSDRRFEQLFFHNPEPRNTGAGGVSVDGRGVRVPVRAFDDLIAAVAGDRGRVRLVKLDCEGSEWPILFTSRRLHQVDALCGEYHSGAYVGPFAVEGFPEFTPAVLEGFLTARGFGVRMRPRVEDPRLGLFFATYQPRAPASGLDKALAGARGW